VLVGQWLSRSRDGCVVDLKTAVLEVASLSGIQT